MLPRSAEYNEAMKAPVREPMEINIVLHFSDPPGTLELSSRDISKWTWKRMVDPISMRLPIDKMSVSYIDFNGEKYKRFDWGKNEATADVTITQYLQDGSTFLIHPKMTMFVKNAKTAKSTSSFDLVDIMDKDGSTEFTGSTFCKFEEEFHTIFDGGSLVYESLDPPRFRYVDWNKSVGLNKCSRIQVIPCDLGRVVSEGYCIPPQKIALALQNMAFRFHYGLYPKNNFTYEFTKPLSTSPAVFSISMKDVLKDGIAVQQGPVVKTIKFEGLEYEADRSIWNSAYPEFSKDTYSYAPTVFSVKLTSNYVDVVHDMCHYSEPKWKLFPSTPHVGGTSSSEYLSPMLERVKAFMPDDVGEDYTIMAQEVLKRSKNTVPQDDPRVESGVAISVKCPPSQTVMDYYYYRNELTLDYRGDVCLEPGDHIDFVVSDTEKYPCLIIANDLTFNGTLKGKLKLKVLQN